MCPTQNCLECEDAPEAETKRRRQLASEFRVLRSGPKVSGLGSTVQGLGIIGV